MGCEGMELFAHFVLGLQYKMSANYLAVGSCSSQQIEKFTESYKHRIMKLEGASQGTACLPACSRKEQRGLAQETATSSCKGESLGL